MTILVPDGHTSTEQSSYENARQTPFVINELILIHGYLEGATFAFFIQLKAACKTHFITCLDRLGSKIPEPSLASS